MVTRDHRRHADPVHARQRHPSPSRTTPWCNPIRNSQPSPGEVRPLRSAAPPGTPSSKAPSASLLPRLFTSKKRMWLPRAMIGGFQDLDRGRVFDHAARVARREVDVLNDRIGGIGRIELARTRPVSRSYGPVLPKEPPPKAQSVFSISMRVTRASAALIDITVVAHPTSASLSKVFMRSPLFCSGLEIGEASIFDQTPLSDEGSFSAGPRHRSFRSRGSARTPVFASATRHR